MQVPREEGLPMPAVGDLTLEGRCSAPHQHLPPAFLAEVGRGGT